MSHAVLAAVGPNLKFCTSSDFDGTNDYVSRGAQLTGVADSKIGIFSAWFRIDSFGGNEYLLSHADTGATGSHFGVRLDPGGSAAVNIFARNGANASICELGSTFLGGSITTGVWHHLILEWAMTRAPSSPVVGYLDDSALIFTVTTATDDTIDYTKNNCFIGALANANFKFNGCLAEMYYAPGQSLDLTVTANRRKFTAYGSLRPLFLGLDGSLPTGTQPIVYIPFLGSYANATAVVNLGSGGNFTATADAGGITAGSSNPSD